MKHEGDVWKLTMLLYEGEYGYAYMVEGYKWVVDPDNPETRINPYKMRCSVLRVGGDLLSVMSAKGDGKIEPRGLYHDQTPRFLDVDGQNVYFKFRTMKGDVSKAMVVIKSHAEKEVEMERVWWDKHFDYYEAYAVISGPARYFFKVVDKDAVAYFSGSGHSCDEDSVVGFKLNPTSFRLFEVPNWVRGAVFYQIFPDRFYNGDTSNDPPNVSKWGDKPTVSNFFGGDLKGIIEKLDYLANLGVDVIYLTPIFSSESNHKYDIYDYYRVDPIFGDKATLKSLVRGAHARGIKVILDGVFHHTADEFWAFEDILKNQRKSKYTDWYFVRKFPAKNRGSLLIKALLRLPLPSKLRQWLRMRFPPTYETFAGVFGMPKLNLLNPETSEYFLKVAEYWIKEADIDGWRLDVAFGIPHEFWKKFRSRVKAVKPNAYLLGELGMKGEVSPWVGEEAFDAVMNYPLRRIILDFFVHKKLDAAIFDRKLAALRAEHPRETAYTMLNLLGSHDTPRFLTLCGGDKELFKVAVAFLFTYVGAPMIYYGDEVGMKGRNDPDCRRPMVWDPAIQDQELLEWHRQLIHIRKAHPALRRGNIQTVHASSDVYAFERQHGADYALVILNVGVKAQTIRLPDESWRGRPTMQDEISGRVYRRSESIEVASRSTQVLVSR